MFPRGSGRRSGRRVAAAVALASFALGACGSSGADESTAVADVPAPSVSAQSEASSVPRVDAGGDDGVVVPAALQFSAPLVGGGSFDGAAHAGKPVAFWFWAPT